VTVEIEFRSEGLPWLLLPSRYPDPEHASPRAAAGFALAYLAEREATKHVRTSWGMKLEPVLAEMSRGQFSGIFLWTAEPIHPFALVTAETYPAQGEAAQTLPLLGGAPEGEPFEVPGLGAGMRFESRSQVRKGLFGKGTRHTVRWVWRIEELDLVVTLERDDAESLARMLPDVEALLAAALVSR
jgi:hypothetical protein